MRENKSGATPLHMAARFGTVATVTALLDAGARIEARIPTDLVYGYTPDNGATPLHFAAGYGTVKIVNALLDAGADIEALNGNGWKSTPLIFAANKGNDATTKALLDAGANIKARDGGDGTPLHSASQNGNAATVYALIYENAEIEARDNQKHTPLTPGSTSSRSPETVKALVYSGANVMAQDNGGWTPLHWAARNFYGSFDTVESINVLLEAGADPNFREKTKGWTPFHLVAKVGTPAMVNAFMNAGASAKEKDNAGLYPYHHAEENPMLKDTRVLSDLLSYTKYGG